MVGWLLLLTAFAAMTFWFGALHERSKNADRITRSDAARRSRT